MKKMTCAQMGGPCEAEIMGENPQEMIANGTAHLKEAHPDMAQGMETSTPEEKAQWEAEFMQKWEATPEAEM